MPEPLSSGYLERWLSAQIEHGDLAVRAGLTSLALAIEGAAMRNASNGAHPYGTPTPARPGNGPAVITGDLRRSLTHTPVEEVGGVLMTRVGPADTPHSVHRARRPRTGSHSGSTNGRVGEALEMGLRNGSRYPFLHPAFDDSIGLTSSLIREGWQVTRGV